MLQEQILARTAKGTGTAVDFTGTWVNELGSTATLTQNGDSLTGNYVSAVSQGGTSACGPLVGYVDGGLIAFSVHWNEFQSITSWVGQIVQGSSGDTIDTLWQMTNQTEAGEQWASINAGSDVFTRK